MEKKQIKINGKIAVEIKINGGLFWKAGGPGPVVEYEYVMIQNVNDYDNEVTYQYSRDDETWYCLNNLRILEPYGVYEKVSDVSKATYYEGKLIDVNGVEYQYLNGQWNNVGAISNILEKVYTFGGSEPWDSTKPFPVNFQLQQNQMKGQDFNPYFMSMDYDIRITYNESIKEYIIRNFLDGSTYQGTITEDSNWIYFKNDFTGDLMIDGIDFWGANKIDMYTGQFNADVEYGEITFNTDDGYIARDCSEIPNSTAKNFVYNVGGYFMANNGGKCEHISDVNPYLSERKFVNVSSMTEFKLYEPAIQSLPSYFITACNNVTDIDMPYLTELNHLVFNGIANPIQNYLIPNVEVVYGAYSSIQRKNVDYTNAKILRQYAFNGVETFKSSNIISMPYLWRIYSSAFSTLGSSFEQFYAPNLKVIGNFTGSATNLGRITLSTNVAIFDSYFYSTANIVTPMTDWNRCWSINSSYTKSLSGNITLSYYGLSYSAFYSHQSITDINLPNAHYIEEGVFSKCKYLKTASFPMLETWNYTLNDCNSVSKIYAPKVQLTKDTLRVCINSSHLSWLNMETTKVAPTHMCYKCSNLSSLFVNGLVSAYENAFNCCSKLTSVSLPNLEFADKGAFKTVPIIDLSLPKLKYAGENAFNTDTNSRPKTLYIPNIEYIGNSAFYRYANSSWSYNFTFSYLTYIGSTAFNEFLADELHIPKCEHLGYHFLGNGRCSTLYLNEVTKVTELETSAFYQPPKSIYVPQSLVSNFKANSMWASYADIIFGM